MPIKWVFSMLRFENKGGLDELGGHAAERITGGERDR